MQALWTFIVVAGTELSTIKDTWEHAVKGDAKHKAVDPNEIILNVCLSGFFFYLYNELAFAFTAEVCLPLPPTYSSLPQPELTLACLSHPPPHILGRLFVAVQSQSRHALLCTHPSGRGHAHTQHTAHRWDP